jgi:hypothetical protein
MSQCKLRKSKRMLFILCHQNSGEIRNIKGAKCGKYQIFGKDRWVVHQCKDVPHIRVHKEATQGTNTK